MVRVALATCRSSRWGLLLRLRRLPRSMAAAGFRGKLSLDRGCDDPAARARLAERGLTDHRNRRALG